MIVGAKKWCLSYSVSDQNPFTGGSWSAGKVTVYIFSPVRWVLSGSRSVKKYADSSGRLAKMFALAHEVRVM